MSFNENYTTIVMKSNGENAMSLDMYTLEMGGVLDESVVKLISLQVTCGVSHLHVNNIAHCDLKKDSVIKDAKFEVKIIDLGFVYQALCSGVNDPTTEFKGQSHSISRNNPRFAILWSDV